ncbi:SusC/RagA family TonB-linked outer membrane protein [Mucilaginibacter aquatilis]|uniref:SusC/RagA family TonB-linked outer membrane protein n=1 Tax=Mucilaginibacter aquatilis TaxID=1517760 RepID=A0A6I4IH08_9SPHI|nr:TonB-dependent receptor [Mucilaginibacter aquatilis]MVN92826.1 SusC/RagA family TonB-linked outer membrane protein [Mucilaginibacter aquatilis]
MRIFTYQINFSRSSLLRCARTTGLLLAFLFCALLNAFAQTTRVEGTVVDEKGEALPGVNVKVKDAQIGAATDVNGRFVLNLNSSSGTLVFSLIGYTTQEQAYTAGAKLSVKLVPNQSALSDVVVVGYGTQRRASITSAVDQVTSAAIQGKPAVNVTQALQGTSPSLIIQQRNNEPGAGININIRGISTLNNNSPLVVVDGIVGGDINLLNPADIESVSVLKDAGSAAIYGSRSSNGVILITTKQGKKNARTQLNYNGLVGIQTPKVFYKPVHGFENAILRNQANVNAGQQPIFSADQIRTFQQQGDTEFFLDAILKNALQQNHNLSLTGGSEKSSYLVSAGFVDQRNNLVGPGLGLRRYNYRLNMTNEYGKLKLNTILAYAHSDIKDHSSNTSTLIVDASRVPLYYQLKDDQGRYLTNAVLSEFNPLGVLEQGGYRKYNNDNIFGSLNAEFAVTDFLKLRGVFGGTLNANHQYARTLQVNYFPGGVSGADRNNNDENYKDLLLNTQFLAEFNKVFNKKHSTTLLLGVSNESFNSERVNLYRKFTDPELGTPITETVIDPNSINSNQGTIETSLNSLFGRANYSFSDKYYGEFSFRVDASSKFNKQNRSAFFPSFSAGYRITQERFMEKYRSNVGDIKLRGSYGILGNQSVRDYQYQTTYSSFQNAYGFNNVSVSGTGFNFANPDIRWERAATLNLGADATFFKNSLNVSLDYFDKHTRDILIPPAVPGVFGSGLPDYNAGEVQNRGWEININYRLNGRNLRHSFNLNIGDNKNKVLYYEGGTRLLKYDEAQVILQPGLPFQSYVGLKRDGYFQTLEEIASGPKPAGLALSPGDIRYVDVNKDGVINDRDNFVLGNPFPRYNFGFTYNVAYKQFDLSVFIQGVGRRSTFVRGELVEPFHFNYGQTMYQHQLDFWTPTNPNAEYPRLAASGSASIENNFRRGSDLYIYNAAYARLKNVQIGYSLPKKAANKLGMQNLRAYLSGQNLYTLSKLKFLDPEASEFNNSLGASGANSGRTYPTPVYVGFGLDVTF